MPMGRSRSKYRRRRRGTKADFRQRYQSYINSNAWRKRRDAALALADWRCSRCGDPDRLEVHHLHYKTFRNEDPARDLQVLCKPCHKHTHGRKVRVKKPELASLWVPPDLLPQLDLDSMVWMIKHRLDVWTVLRKDRKVFSTSSRDVAEDFWRGAMGLPRR